MLGFAPISSIPLASLPGVAIVVGVFTEDSIYRIGDPTQYVELGWPEGLLSGERIGDAVDAIAVAAFAGLLADKEIDQGIPATASIAEGLQENSAIEGGSNTTKGISGGIRQRRRIGRRVL